MRLPDRLDYYEVPYTFEDGIEEDYPLVFCTVPGCKWTYDGATWSDFGEDQYARINWDEVHPAHGAGAAKVLDR